MATNTRVPLSPRLDIPASIGGVGCTGAHSTGDLAFEGGKFGVCVRTNIVGGDNVLFTHGSFLLPVPAGTARGIKLYIPTASLTDGATLQAVGNTYRSTAVTSVLTAVATAGTYIGTTVDAAHLEGATTMATVEFAAQ